MWLPRSAIYHLSVVGLSNAVRYTIQKEKSTRLCSFDVSHKDQTHNHWLTDFVKQKYRASVTIPVVLEAAPHTHTHKTLINYL